MNSYFNIDRAASRSFSRFAGIRKHPRCRPDSRVRLRPSERQTRHTSLTRLGVCIVVSLLRSACFADDGISFRSDIAPILLDHCVACHGAKKAEGGYRLDTFAEMSKTGDSGIEPLERADSGSTEFLRRLTTDDESERMPAESDPLTPDQIEHISQWLDSGASFDGNDTADLLPFVIPPPRHQQPPKKYDAALEVTALAFSSDGTELISSGYHELLVWNFDGRLTRRIDNIGQRTFSLTLDPSGNRLAVAGGQPGKSGEVRIVDLESGEVVSVFGRTTDVNWDVAFRPNHKEIAVASADKTIRIVNLETLNEVRLLQSHADWVTSIDWTPNGDHLLSTSRDKSAKVFDADNGQLLVSYKGHDAAVRDVAISTDGKHALSVGADKRVHRWNILDGKKVATIGLGGEGFQLIGRDSWAFVACGDKRLIKIDLATNKFASDLNGHTDWVLSVASSPDGSRIATGSYDGEIFLWDAATGALLNQWSARP